MGSKEENVEPGIPRQDAFDPAQRPNPPRAVDPAVCIFLLTPPRGASWNGTDPIASISAIPRWGLPHQCLLVPLHNFQAEMDFSQLAWLGLEGHLEVLDNEAGFSYATEEDTGGWLTQPKQETNKLNTQMA